MMSKERKMLCWWSVFITILATIYAVLYNVVPIKEPIMWCSYVSLGIFFTSGGDIKEIPSFSLCAVSGFLWGLLCLGLMGLTAGLGFYPSLIIGVVVSVLGCCLVHMTFLNNTILNKCPMCFGAFAVCFATGGTNGITVCATMIAGLILGGMMSYTGKWANKLAGIEEEA